MSSFEQGMDIDLPFERPLTLGDLADLAVESRARAIEAIGRADIADVLQRLEAAGAPLPKRLRAERLTWCVAWNVTGHPGSGDAPPEGRRHDVRGYRKNKKWTVETPWQTIWTLMVSSDRRRVDSNPSPTPLLGDLALSVFCERRADWQPPEALALDLTEAEAAFDYVYAENYSRVLKGVRAATWGGKEAERLSAEAWSTVYIDSWGVKARWRFSGLCRIATFVRKVAHNRAMDELRHRRRLLNESEMAGTDAEGDRPSLDDLVHDAGLLNDGIAAAPAVLRELRAHVLAAMAALPPKRHLVARMVWLKRMSQHEVALSLGRTDEVVAEHMKLARRDLRQYLRDRGFQVSDEPTPKTRRQGGH